MLCFYLLKDCNPSSKSWIGKYCISVENCLSLFRCIFSIRTAIMKLKMSLFYKHTYVTTNVFRLCFGNFAFSLMEMRPKNDYLFDLIGSYFRNFVWFIWILAVCLLEIFAIQLNYDTWNDVSFLFVL